MVVESPTHGRLPSFGLRLTYIVEQGSPAQPDVIRAPRYVVQYFERMVEVVLVLFSIARLDIVQCAQFGQDDREQTAALQFDKTDGRQRSTHDFVQFFDDSLAADDA